MRKSIMAILNRRAKKKKVDEDDVKENQVSFSFISTYFIYFII
jgi:hypothetical protein